MIRRWARSEAIIAAPVDVVWSVMTDVAAYASWNPFVVRVDAERSPVEMGDLMTLHVRWSTGGGASSLEETVELVAPHGAAPRARWVYVFRGPMDRFGLVRAERLQELEALGPRSTRYSTSEFFTGLLSPFVPLAKVQEGFDRQTAALKARAER